MYVYEFYVLLSSLVILLHHCIVHCISLYIYIHIDICIIMSFIYSWSHKHSMYYFCYDGFINEQRIALGITELPLPGVEAARWPVAMAIAQCMDVKFLLPSGKHTKSYWKYGPFRVDLPIKKRWFSIVMLNYQRVNMVEVLTHSLVRQNMSDQNPWSFWDFSKHQKFHAQ